MAALTACLTACGGGGSDGGSTSGGGSGGGGTGGDTTTPSVPGTPSAATCGLSNFQQTLLDRINALRAAGASCGTAGSFAATGAVSWNSLLSTAAEGHAQDMATQNYFSHTSLDGRSLADRVNAAGYSWSALGENIAAGYSTVDAVMDGWRSSDGHCANLMNPSFTELGVACVAAGAGASYPSYWVMDLGTPR